MRLTALLVTLCAARAQCAPVGRAGKRQNTWYVPVANAVENVLSKAAGLVHLTTPPFVYHADMEGSKLELIDDLWSSAWVEGIYDRFTAVNPALTYLLEEQRVDDADAGDNRWRQLQGQSRWEAVFMELFRARSQKWVPASTAAISTMMLYYRVPNPIWDTLRYFGRGVMSRTWTEGLCDLAVSRDPGPAYKVVEGITAAVFDNLNMNVDYSAFMTGGEAGHKIEMTNWATVFLPASAMPAGFQGIDALLGAGGIFKPLLNMDDFLDSFSMHAPDIVQAQRVRWARYLEWASVGCIWDTDQFNSPYPPTKFHWHDPIFDRLQASYDDVNFEIKHMRSSNYHKYSDCLMLGGDGLSYMRVIHRMSQDRRQFLETTPVVIPRLGENPHGLFHIMHGDWRIWAPLLMRFAALVGNRQVRADPTVALFNQHQHFLRIVIQACAEYVEEISRTGTDYHLSAAFLRAFERNLSFGEHRCSFAHLCPPRIPIVSPRILTATIVCMSPPAAYIVFFLYMFGFKFLEYRHAVRHNESHALDRLWRENLVSARTALANKTNYRQMSIILVYWGLALLEPLQTFYHNTRTIRWIHSHVGWDMPIEKLNMWIKESVITNISKMQICTFIWRLNFMQHVWRAVMALVRRGRKRETATPRDVQVDVDKIKEFLREHIGTTFAQATQPSDIDVLGIDMADWGGLRNPRGQAPFNQIRRSQNGYREFVEAQVTKLCRWQHWS